MIKSEACIKKTLEGMAADHYDGCQRTDHSLNGKLRDLPMLVCLPSIKSQMMNTNGLLQSYVESSRYNQEPPEDICTLKLSKPDGPSTDAFDSRLSPSFCWLQLFMREALRLMCFSRFLRQFWISPSGWVFQNSNLHIFTHIWFGQCLR